MPWHRAEDAGERDKFLLGGGCAICCVAAANVEESLIEIDVAEQSECGEPRLVARGNSVATHRLYIQGGIRTQQERPNAPTIWWDGEGWLDSRSRPVIGPLALMLPD